MTKVHSFGPPLFHKENANGKTWASTQPHTSLWTPEFLSCPFILARHIGTKSSFHKRPVLCLVLSLFNWLVNGACFPSHVVWSQGIPPTSSPTSIWMVSVIIMWVISEVLCMVAALYYDWIKIVCGASGTVAPVTKVHCLCDVSCCLAVDRKRLQ